MNFKKIADTSFKYLEKTRAFKIKQKAFLKEFIKANKTIFLKGESPTLKTRFEHQKENSLINQDNTINNLSIILKILTSGACNIWDEVSKNRPSIICGRQPFKNVK